MARIEIDHSQVNVIEMNPSGGDPVIMVHGLLTNLSVYYFGIAPVIAQDHRVVLYDLRSHGMSQRRDEGYTLEIFANDMLNLMEKLQIDRAHLVGYSYGGAIALYMALAHPDKVARLGLIEAPSLKGQSILDLVDGRRRTAGELIDNYTKSTGITVARVQAEIVEDQYRFLTDNGQLVAAVEHDQFFTDTYPLEELQAPTILIYGASSELLEIGQEFISRIPQAQFRLAQGDHNLPVQQGEFVANELRRFFSADADIASADTASQEETV